MSLDLRDKGDRWRCALRGCRKEVGLRKDTWLENANLPFREVVLFIYCWSKELTTTVEFCKHELEINKNTVVVGIISCVKSVQPTCLQTQLPLEGPTLRSRWTRACLLAGKITRDGSYRHNGYSEGFAGKHASVLCTPSRTGEPQPCFQ